ncbi:MAG: mucoidy inhibitor MuiA family protein [Alphaproteobacteria bacterium]
MRLSVCCVAFISFLSYAAQAEPIEAKSHITAVTVYSDRATVTREAEVHLLPGSSTVVFSNLPASVYADSLRAQGSARGAVTLGAVENKIIVGSELAAPRERELQTKLQEWQDKRALVLVEKQAIDVRRDFLAKLGERATDITGNNFTHLDLHSDQWLTASTVLYTGMGETLKATQMQELQLRQIDAQIAAVQQDISAIHTGQKSTLSVSIPLDSSEATDLKIQLSYQVPNATWRPIYDARLDTAGASKLALTQFGEVRQTTGEDWSDVALTLSTAQPARGATPPVLGTTWVSLFEQPKQDALSELRAETDRLRISTPNVRQQNLMRAQAAIASGGSAFPTPMAMFAAPAAALAPPPPQEAVFQPAVINTGGYVNEYKIPGTATVASDNSKRKVMIGSLETTSVLLAQIRPALNSNAFLVARTKLGGDAPLLPGTASLFRDGVFIGSSELALLRPGEETTLGFGIDDQIVVKHQVLADLRGSDGLISKENTLDRKVTTQVQNLHRFAVKTEVLEALPVAKDDRIKVDVISDATTAGYEKDADHVTGVARWALDIPAGEKKQIDLGWHMVWPADAQLAGVL